MNIWVSVGANILGWPVPPFLSDNDSASILSGDACPQDYTTLKIICVASVLEVPQDTTFYKEIWKNIQRKVSQNFVLALCHYDSEWGQ